MVKQKRFWKSAFKAIKNNFSRFLAMISITVLSAAIITGLLVTAPNMKYTVSEQYELYQTPDLELILEIGFDDDTINEISKTYDNILPVFKSDKVVKINDTKQLSALVYEFDSSYKDFSHQIEIIEGNLPSNEFEVLIERDTYHIEALEVGDVISYFNDDGNLEEYTVSGIVKNLWYYSKEEERSLLTGDTYELIFYKDRRDLDLFSSVFITFDKPKGLDHFSNKYTNLVDVEISAIEKFLINTLIEIRINNEIFKELAKYPPLPEEMIETIKNEVRTKAPKGFYTLSRMSNLSYLEFKSLIEKVEAITQIFPFFFLIVSILVVLTTMTRMIEEERQQVGILRSIGYHKGSIYRKYVLYGSLIGILGSGIGYAAGFRLIPTIINNAFQIIFHLEPLNLNVYSLSNLIYLGIIVLSIVLTSVFAVMKTLRQTPAEMLIPRSPKLGKRIVLERMPFIWNKLKFKYKSTLRNLFRYPKHLIMTVFGVMGSLALVFTGLALTDSVDAISSKQFEEIIQYDLSVHLKEEDSLVTNYLNNNNLGNYIYTYQMTDILKSVKTNESFYVTIVVLEDADGFFLLKNRESKEMLSLTNDGVIVSEQISIYLEKDVNDILKVKNEELVIKGITENYLSNYIYMSRAYFDTLNYNMLDTNIYLLANGDINDFDIINDELFLFNNVLSLEFTEQELISKQRQFTQINLLAVVIVAAAIFLQIVIIYNLTNVNISERDKELSTLKVLGYTNYEVSTYIYREINIMTALGIIFGLPLGILVQRYVIFKVDSPSIMMGRNINWYTYLISIFLTIIMTLIVEFIMYFKIRNIDMISALKEL